jgi:hypothetical protein
VPNRPSSRSSFDREIAVTGFVCWLVVESPDARQVRGDLVVQVVVGWEQELWWHGRVVIAGDEPVLPDILVRRIANERGSGGCVAADARATCGIGGHEIISGTSPI